jgi:hypothetical protein
MLPSLTAKWTIFSLSQPLTAITTITPKSSWLNYKKKFQGSALDLFSSLNAQHYYLGGGRGIEMIKALVDKFHPLEAGAIQSIMSSKQILQLQDSGDLNIYRDKLENLNLQLSWVGQGMPESYLIHLAQLQLKKSRYSKDIDALQISNTASGTSFQSLHEFFLGLERLDCIDGLPYGGAVISKPQPKPYKKPTSNLGMVASVQDATEGVHKSLDFHSESWIGAINLNEDHVKMLQSLFKCPLCRTNTHTFPSCPYLRNWVIKKKTRQDLSQESSQSGAVHSAIVGNTEEYQDYPSSTEEAVLETIHESSYEDDYDSNVDVDLLPGASNNQDNDFSGEVYPYLYFEVPLGSVKSVSSSLKGSTNPSTANGVFNVIIDSGCTRHVFPYQDSFINYKPCSHSFVVLADKSKTACLGTGTISISLGGKHIILHDVLHVHSLRSPLISVRCLRRLKGCSFLCDNSGCFLTFPKFILQVDDSSDCIILGKNAHPSSIPHFDSRLVGNVSAVSDNTRHRLSRHPVLARPSNKNTISPTIIHPDSSTDTNYLDISINGINPLPIISEESNLHLPVQETVCDLPIQETLCSPGENIASSSSSSLSPKQKLEIIQQVTRHLETHGRITTELLQLLNTDKSSSRNNTSTTPPDHPTLLSSDKMSNSAPISTRFTIQQSSRYYGFRSFKNWDVLHYVCQSNFSFIKPTDKMLELGDVANIKRTRSDKIHIERPAKYLEVVHCGIGFGDVKSIGNGALYCLTLVD